MRAGELALYWFCGGEILTRGGRLPLSRAGVPVEAGCRILGPEAPAALRVFYLLKADAEQDPSARRHCLDCARQLEICILAAERWRRAA